MQDTTPARSVAHDASGHILTTLRNARLRPATFRTTAGRSAGGLSVGVNLCGGDSGEVEAVLRQCRRSLQQFVPVNLAIGSTGAGNRFLSDLQRVGEAIHQAVGEQLLTSGQFGVTLQAGARPLRACRLISQLLPPQVPRYLLLDTGSPPGNPAAAEQMDAVWTFAWRHRGDDAPLLPVYAAQARTACPLLDDEQACAVLPAGGVVVPAGSAWLPVELHLPDYSDGRGALHWRRLQRALELCVDLGNSLLDTLVWSDSCQVRDAVRNRRLAISLSGIGDLVAKRGEAPGDLSSLKNLSDDMARLRQYLWRRSEELARRIAPVPALSQNDPTVAWHDQPHRQAWQRKWSAALQASAVRNRNLLVLSPYSVLPRGEVATIQYADLLPVLKFADAWSFANAPRFERWNASEFRRFHQRASAIIRRQNATSFIAAGV